jgi:hypothetical protein
MGPPRLTLNNPLVQLPLLSQLEPRAGAASR